jgi:MFS-type transporter involved in bile tolerance (Atg22 family)
MQPWYLVFSLPLIFLVSDTRSRGEAFARAVRDGIGQLAATARRVRRFAHIARFLVARMIYIDALVTIFALGGVYAAGAFMGIFVGPVQAAGRSYMARATSEELRNQMFGLYAFSGKATAFVGPLLVGWLTYLSRSQRVGMSTILVLLTVGGILMVRVPRPS